MAQAAPIINAFNSGEWSSDLLGRVDNDYYASSCLSSINFAAKVQGPTTKRPGTKFVTRPKFNDKKARLIKFQFNISQTYFLEFGDGYIRVFSNHGSILESVKTITGVTQANPAVVTSAAHGFSNGDWVYISGVVGMTRLNGRTFKVAGVATNTFQLQDVDGNNINSTGYGAYVSGGTVSRVYEIVSPYTEADLPKLRFTQSADVMFIACEGKPPKTLSRSGNTSWTFADYDYTDGPYMNHNTTAVTIAPSATTGTVTLTASTSMWTASDVGRWVRIKSSTNVWGAAKITAYTSGTAVTAQVHANFPFANTTASKGWRLGLWTNTTWPRVVEFFQNRLWWFTGFQADASYSGDFYSFSPTLTDGTVTDSNAIQRPLGSRDVNFAEWAVDNEKALLVGTRDGEWIIRANSLGDAVTPTNCNAVKSTDFGSAPVQGLRVQSKAVFVQRTQRIICNTGYDLNVDGFDTQDLNLFNTAINEGLVKEICYISNPDNILFGCKKDGSMSMLTYNPSQQVRGWQHFVTNGDVESIASGTSPDETRDEVWMITRRYINGRHVRMIEYMEDFFRHFTLQEDGYFVDCGMTYDGRDRFNEEVSVIVDTTGDDKTIAMTADSGVFSNTDVGKLVGFQDGMVVRVDEYVDAANVNGVVLRDGTARNGVAKRFAENQWWMNETVTSVSGLDHLNGVEVSIVGDGAVLVSAIVSDGRVTFADSPSSVVHVGIPYTSRLVTNRLNAGAADGTAQGKIKRIDKLVMRLWRSLGGVYGGEESQFLDPITLRVPQDPMDMGLPLQTGDTDILDMPSDFTLDGRIVIEHNEPLPFTIVAIMPRLLTQDGR